MDVFMKNFERLADLARLEQEPLPLDASVVMERLRGLEIEGDEETPPIRLFLGGALVAAAAAAFALFTAQSAWQELVSPLNAMGSFIEVLDIVQ